MVLSIALLGKYVHFPLSFFFCMISSVCIVMEVQLLTQLSRKTAIKLFCHCNTCRCMEIIFLVFISVRPN